MGELAMDNYYVYIVTNKNRETLETGLSGALSIRLRELESELTEKNNEKHCVHLLYWESYENPTEAMTRSKDIKKMSKKKKIELINSNNPQWLFLNERIHKAHDVLVVNPQVNTIDI
jgi:putative endonuclease